MGLGWPGPGGLAVGRLGFGALGLSRPGVAKTGAGGLELSGLGCGFRSGFSLLAARGFFLARLLQRDLLPDRLILAHRFLIGPVLAGRLAIGGPRRGGPVQP